MFIHRKIIDAAYQTQDATVGIYIHIQEEERNMKKWEEERESSLKTKKT